MYPSLLFGEPSRAELLNHRAEPSRAFKFTKPSLNELQACRKVLKVGGAIALEPAKSWGGGG